MDAGWEVEAGSWIAVRHGWQGGDPSWLLGPGNLFAQRKRSGRNGGRVPLPGGTGRTVQVVRNCECKRGRPAVKLPAFVIFINILLSLTLILVAF